MNTDIIKKIKEELKHMKYIDIHNHTHRSNLRLLDCIIKEKDLVDYAIELGHTGVCITDHECISGHIEILQYVLSLRKDKETVEKMRKEGVQEKELVKKFKNLELLDKVGNNFKLGLGNEIYLVDNLEDVRDNYISGETKFYHFILVAKDKIGHKQLRELSSQAWKNSFYTGQMERVPTIKKDMEKIIGNNKGHLIGSTACLGGELANLVLKLHEAQLENNEHLISSIKIKIHKFISWCIEIFTKENFYIEIQPSKMEEQIVFNKMAIHIAKAYGLKYIITTDTHYLKKEHRQVHAAYLNSKEGDREVDDFYSSTYMMSTNELYDYLKDYLTLEEIKTSIENTQDIYNKLEIYDLQHGVIVPEIKPPNFKLSHLFKHWYDKYEYIKKYAYSPYIQDLYFLYLIEQGFEEKRQELNDENLNRINIELKELWLISENIKMRLSAYYVLTRKIVDIMWDDNMGNSLVGVARGSVTGFYTAYLISITQLNPIKWNLPHWRHVTATRPELPDVDLDSEALKRQGIFDSLKQFFGFDNVLNICTFKTEGSKSTVLTSCRGLEIDNDIAQFIADLIPFERGSNWSLEDCFYGNEEKERKPLTEFINEVSKYPNLKETMMAISNLISGRSIHASGVYVFKNGYLDQNSLMKAPNGQYTTAWNMADSDYCGGLKVDCLTIEALDKIRTELDLLVEYKKIEWQGNLKNTYNKYMHPDVLDYKTKEMWEMIGDNKIEDLFQFNTKVGLEASRKIKPYDLPTMAIGNSVMRLMGDGETNPIDTFVKYKNNIKLWYKELKEWKLNEEEIKILERYLLHTYGVATTQEDVMELVMEEKICNFSLKEANKLRKAIAKKKPKLIEECKQLFYNKGLETKARLELLNYVWKVQIKRQLGYSFSRNHTTPYSVIGLQEMNLAYHYNMLFWNCSVLTINAGAGENELDNNENKKKTKITNYGKIATAIGQMQNRGVKVASPHINKAKFGFTPDENANEIIFGLKGISGVGDDAAYEIINHRPYNSLIDFHEKLVKTKKEVILSTGKKQNKSLVPFGTTISLIKAGAFDSIEKEKNREQIMRNYLKLNFPDKKTLDMRATENVANLGIVPQQHKLAIRVNGFKNYVVTKNNFIKQDEEKKSKQWYILKGHNEITTQKTINFFQTYFMDDMKENEDYYYDEQGNIIFSCKLKSTGFEKVFDKLTKDFKQWLKSSDCLDRYNNFLFKEKWEKYASGNVSKWEMDSLSFYYHKHELANVNKEKYFIRNFSDLPEEPIIQSYGKYKDREYPIFKLYRIAGTVLDKDKNKHMVTLLTINGEVVTLKFYSGQFSFYDKTISEQNDNGDKTTIEESWFKRGQLIIVSGYRRNDVFKPKKYKDSAFQHTVYKIIEVGENGELSFQTERYRGE
ncbi:TPA: DNA polymerase III subunit alpha [Clostridium botulinum]|nr:DNA polymerase III subunit alpha [Clostridium botulinum]